MSVVGITGGIGSGKSVVARLVRMYGFPVYDSDARAKALYDENQELTQQLRTEFGDAIFVEGRLQKQRLAALVFSDADKLQRLNAIVHPAVFRDFRRWAQAQRAPLVFVESAILLQTDFVKMVDKIVVVDAPESERMVRVMARDNVSATNAASRISAQLSAANMRAKADYVIENDAVNALLPQVDSLLKSLTQP